MRKQGLLGILLMVVVLTTTACGSDGDGGADPPTTLDDVCVDEGGALCERAIECFPDGAPSQSECVTIFRAACCGDDGTCSMAVTGISRDEWNTCLDAYPAFACSELDAGNIPPECASFKPEMMARLRHAYQQALRFFTSAIPSIDPPQ